MPSKNPTPPKPRAPRKQASNTGGKGNSGRDQYGLTRNHREFVDLYRAGPDDIKGNATACYMAVYPRASKRTAEQRSCHLLKDPNIVEYLERVTERITAQADINQARVLKELAAIGFSDTRKLFYANGKMMPVNEWPDDVAAAVSMVEFDAHGYVDRVKLWDKNSALEKIGKHLKMFTDIVRHEGEIELTDKQLDTRLAILLRKAGIVDPAGGAGK